MRLYISTLGEFDIKADGQSILKDSSRMYKIYRLFEYFLTFRNKKLLPETIIDNLLSDSESDDPKNMLRTQIFRLRKIINAFIPKNEDAADYLSLNFINGYSEKSNISGIAEQLNMIFNNLEALKEKVGI